MDLDAVSAELVRRFIQRKDVKATQHPDGSWRPIRSDWTKGDLRKHLRGEQTFGHYLVDPNGKCKLFALDIDLDKGGARELWQSDAPADDPDRVILARQMQALTFGLAYRAHRALDLPMAVAYSGSKGMHVYGFSGTIDAAVAKQLATVVLQFLSCEPVRGDCFFKNPAYENFTIEVFPKQDEVGEGGLGNLMRLPLGRNHKGSALPPPFNRPAFLAEHNLKWKVDDPLSALTEGSTRYASEPAVGQQ